MSETLAHFVMTHPTGEAFAITPDDGADLPSVTRGLYVGAAGDVSVVMYAGGAAVTFTALAAGIIHPIRARRVRSTGTTATGIVGVL